MAKDSVKIMVRCPEYVLQLVDTVCNMYGFSRAEIMRMGAINYCQSILATDALKNVCDMAFKLNSEIENGQTLFTETQKAQIVQLNEMAVALSKSLGLE